MIKSKINQASFAQIRKQLILKTLPLVFLTIIYILYTNLFKPNANENTTTTVISIVLILLVILFSGYISVSRQIKLLRSYTVTIYDTHIVREQDNTPIIKINNSDISNITKSSNGSLVIYGKVKSDLIGIPNHMNDFENLEARLKQLFPITPQKNPSFIYNLRIPLVLLTLASLWAVYSSNNTTIVVLCGILCIGIMVWGFIETQNSKHCDNKLKRISYISIFPIISIIFIILSKLNIL